MSADIYTKPFEEIPAWDHALKLINFFGPKDLDAQSIYEWINTRHELANIPNADSTKCAGWSKDGKRKTRADTQPKAKAKAKTHAAPAATAGAQPIDMSTCVSCGVMFPGNCRCTFCCPAVEVDSDDEILNFELFSEINGRFDS